VPRFPHLLLYRVLIIYGRPTPCIIIFSLKVAYANFNDNELLSTALLDNVWVHLKATPHCMLLTTQHSSLIAIGLGTSATVSTVECTSNADYLPNIELET
jgi:hypothetical protein